MSRTADLIVARDAELEGRHEIAEQLRGVDCEWVRRTFSDEAFAWRYDLRQRDWLEWSPHPMEWHREYLGEWVAAWNDEPL